MPIGGGAATVLASAQQNPFGIAVDASGAYFTAFVAGGAVLNVPLAGGTPTVLASGQDNPRAVAIDATTIYWTNQGTGANGTIMKLAK